MVELALISCGLYWVAKRSGENYSPWLLCPVGTSLFLLKLNFSSPFSTLHCSAVGWIFSQGHLHDVSQRNSFKSGMYSIGDIASIQMIWEVGSFWVIWKTKEKLNRIELNLYPDRWIFRDIIYLMLIFGFENNWYWTARGVLTLSTVLQETFCSLIKMYNFQEIKLIFVRICGYFTITIFGMVW